MHAQIQIDPNSLIDTTGIGWEEVLLAVVVMVAAVLLAALTRRVVRSTVLKWSGTQPDLAAFLGKVARWSVLMLGLIAGLMILGVQLGPIALLLGVVVVVLFVSGRELLENFGAGIVIQGENPFRIGDLVEIDTEMGLIRDITARTTVLDTYDGRTIRIPNGRVLRNPIVNLSEREALRTDVAVGLEYGTDLNKAREVLLDVVENIDGIHADPRPQVLVDGFGASSIDLSVRFWHEPSQLIRNQLTDAVCRAIDASCRDAGLVIAFPQLVVWAQDSPG